MNVLEELKSKLQDKVNFKISDIKYYKSVGGVTTFYATILNTPFDIEFPNFESVLDESDEDSAASDEFKIYPDEEYGLTSVNDLVDFILNVSTLVVNDSEITINTKTLDSIIKSFNTLYFSINEDTFDNKQDFEDYLRKQNLLED